MSDLATKADIERLRERLEGRIETASQRHTVRLGAVAVVCTGILFALLRLT